MKPLIPVVLATTMLAACQQSSTIRSSDSGGYVRLEGATLVVNRAIEVPAGRARVFLQSDGSSGSRALTGGFNHFRTHCGIEVRSIAHDGFTIRPGEFRVTRVQSAIQPVVQQRPVQVAALQLATMDGDGGSSAYYEGYHFWLASDTQPDVMRLSCFGAYAEPPDLQPPTLQEIDRALGDIAQLRR